LLETDARWQLVQRIVATPGFVRSPRLVSFLLFVSERSLGGEPREVNEQSIGVSVFGRAEGYDSNDDNIVRSHASRLRLKLQTYFEQEGADEELRVHIPKGSYVPVFTRYFTETTAVPAPPVPARMDPPPAAQNRRFPVILSVLLAVVLVLWALDHRATHAAPPAAPESNRELWSHFFPDARQTLIVPGDSGLVLYENMSGRNLNISEYTAGKYLAEPLGEATLNPQKPDPDAMIKLVARRRYTSIVDLNMVTRLMQMGPVLPRASIRYARDLRAGDLKDSNAILLGTTEANPWVALFDDKLNFTMSADQTQYVFTIRNRAPRPGEQAIYQTRHPDPANAVYALVALVPNLSGTGRVLILQGTGMAATEAAADFITTSGEFKKLLSPHLGPGQSVPNFEILLQANNLAGESPGARVLAARYDKAH